jgi:integrase/recombinase XerD
VLAGAGGVGQHDCSAVTQPAQQHVTLLGGDREQGRALIAAADRDPGRARLRSAAAILLLLHNALRVDEVLGADLGSDSVLTVLGKGNRRAKVPLTPATVVALHTYLDYRAAASITEAALEYRPWACGGRSGRCWPPPVVAGCGPASCGSSLAAAAEITEWDRLSAHSLRHTGITRVWAEPASWALALSRANGITIGEIPSDDD